MIMHKGCEIIVLKSENGWRALVLYGDKDESTEYLGSRDMAKAAGIRLAEKLSKGEQIVIGSTQEQSA